MSSHPARAHVYMGIDTGLWSPIPSHHGSQKATVHPSLVAHLSALEPQHLASFFLSKLCELGEEKVCMLGLVPRLLPMGML